MPPKPTDRSQVQINENRLFRVQRGFTAWIAATYAFVLMTLGSASLVVTVFGKFDIFVLTTLTMCLILPNFILSSLIWSKVYGHKV